MSGHIIRVRNAIMGRSVRTRRANPRDSRESDPGYFLAAGSTAIASACVYVAST